MIRLFITGSASIALLLTLTACETKEILPGERISLFDLEKKLRVANPDQRKNIRLPKPITNKDWPQIGGNAKHLVRHLALSADPAEPVAKGTPREVWRVSAGEEGAIPFPSPPIIARDKIFVLDGIAQLHALRLKDGKKLWKKNLRREQDSDEDGAGGAIAYAAGRIFVATGFGTIAALEAENGRLLWREDLDIPLRAAPIIDQQRVYFMTFDNQLTARDIASGREVWSHRGIDEVSSPLMISSVAVNQNIVVVPYHSGEVFALNAPDKGFLWSDNLLRQGLATAALRSGFVAIPVMDENRAYLISNADYMVAINLADGQRLWSQNISGINMPWIAGKQIYVLSRNNLLLCLSSNSGSALWREMLPSEDGEIWHGPILAGSSLWLTSSNGRLARVSPANGRILSIREIADGFRVAPIVAQRTILLLSSDMELIALRIQS